MVTGVGLDACGALGAGVNSFDTFEEVFPEYGDVDFGPLRGFLRSYFS